MPKHPVYIAMLPESARAVIGVPHPSGRAAMRMLENEGFAFENYVDIFDGGPTMTARTDQVASVRDARHVELAGIGDGGEEALIATGRLGDFRCCFGQVGADGTIDAKSAGLLGVGAGDEVSWIGR
jgi:arginine N-succinyltransferase